MGNNVIRFLRKHKKQYYYQLVYSRKIDKLDVDSAIYLQSFKHNPGKGVFILNILITANRVFDTKINRANMELINAHYDVVYDTVHDYMMRISSIKHEHSNLLKLCIPSQKAALKEQKARGFIKKSKWWTYDKKYAHIQSLANPEYVYPLNLNHWYGEDKKFKPDHYSDIIPYVFMAHVGVQGWSRIILPN